MSRTSFPKTPKHVIFLGAGASVTSHYPLAKDLRFLMASTEALKKQIEEVLANFPAGDPGRNSIMGQFAGWAKPIEGTLKLFREGGFGTIDEFCYLTRNKRPREVSDLKRAMRLALGIHNPEDRFADSDYYPFIQKLFEKDLQTLRKDIVVFSLNYDPYLEWLLYRAVQTRLEASDGKKILDVETQTAVTSGFLGRQRDIIRQNDGFCLLKLHGTVAWPGTLEKSGQKYSDCTWNSFFSPSVNRIKALVSPWDHGESIPPIVFPWEIFVDEKNFALTDPDHEPGVKAGGYTGSEVSLHNLFQTIWARATDEVQAASKISFIGLSMHEYLEKGFRMLFEGKTGKIDLVVADKSCHGAPRGAAVYNGNTFTPDARISNLLKEICPLLTHEKETYISFRDFIANEMTPIRQRTPA